ncbi:hypothetical protein GIB67_020896 [Kingdonia uniflora]|uniref:Uncharacterized protein n=1 Tax=Kingdonia uniflora TaxID=39325 RepID=A0A7J7M7G6_9MAGN|nr:hypothetical protein GIB67_020896 [Kingdonia uniflora]
MSFGYLAQSHISFERVGFVRTIRQLPISRKVDRTTFGVLILRHCFARDALYFVILSSLYIKGT